MMGPREVLPHRRCLPARAAAAENAAFPEKKPVPGALGESKKLSHLSCWAMVAGEGPI